MITILQIFKDATLFFSRNMANNTTVIPAIDHINSHLATAARNKKYLIAIQAALAIRKKKLKPLL